MGLSKGLAMIQWLYDSLWHTSFYMIMIEDAVVTENLENYIF
jgi:hypothetical protein